MPLLRTCFGFRSGLAVINRHRRTYITMNAITYGAVGIAMAVGAVFPRLHADVLAQTNRELARPGIIRLVTAAYANGDVPVASTLTFLINLGFGAFATTTAPSFLVPFFGVAFTIWRVVQWGLLFTPSGPDAGSLLPHYLTLVVEGQAYILAAFAVVLHGRMFLQPSEFALASRWAGYKAGISATARIYPLIAVLLLVAAVYEALEVIHLAKS